MFNSTRNISRALSIVIILSAALILIGLIFNIPFLRLGIIGGTSMKFNTAVCFMLSGVALFLLNTAGSRLQNTIIFICACLVLMIGGVSLAEYLFSRNFGIDELLVAEHGEPISGNFPGRMSQVAAVNFILLGIVLLLLQKNKYPDFTRVLLIVIVPTSVLTVMIYLFGPDFINVLPLFSNTSLYTAIFFILCCTAVVYSPQLGASRFAFQKKIAFFFILVSLLLGMIFYAYDKNHEKAVDTNKLVDHTYEVLFRAEAIKAQVEETQNKLRGFMITGMEKDLPSFGEAADTIEETIQQLRTIATDNIGQIQRIDTLKKLTEAYISFGKELIEIRRNKSFEEAKKVFLNGRDELMRVQMNSRIMEIVKEEDKLLEKRKTENERGIQSSSRIINVFRTFAVLLLLIALLVIYSNSRRRNRAETEIKLLNATLEKRVEEKSREIIEKEQQYRFLLQNMREGIQVIGYDWKYVFVNDSVVEQAKYSKPELMGHTMMEKYPGIEDTELFEVLKRCMDERKSEIFESEFTFPDATKEYFELSIQPVPEGIFILSMDITERKKTEEELRISEEKYRTIFLNSPLPMWLYDFKTLRFLNVNEAATRHYGYTLDEFLSMTIKDIRTGEQIEPLSAELAKIETDANRRMGNWLHRKKNGEIIMVEITAHAIDYGNKKARMVIVNDVTERRKSEEKLKEYAEELKSSNAELERFAYIASHDLQEPLRMVSSFLTLLEKKLAGQLDEDGKSYIHFATDGASRMKILIQDLLVYSRVGSNKEEFTLVDMDEVIHYTQMLLDENIKETNARLTWERLPSIRANKTLITQLLVNLVNNALKYHGKTDPVIEVGCTENHGAWVFYVSDNGIGIDPKYFDKIFIIFQRLYGKSEYSGTGIGLAICKKIIEIHKGKIWVESEPGKGSKFYFSIPK